MLICFVEFRTNVYVIRNPQCVTAKKYAANMTDAILQAGFLHHLLLALLQELGGCGLKAKCYWAHGTDDLDTKAFSFDFPLVNANRQPGEWDRVGKKPLAVRTGKDKQAAWQGAGTSAWGAAQHHRSA